MNKGKDKGERLVNSDMQRANHITEQPRLDSTVGMNQKQHLPSENVDGILIQHVVGINNVAETL